MSCLADKRQHLFVLSGARTRREYIRDSGEEQRWPTVGHGKTTSDAEREYGEETFTASEVARTERSKTICGYFESDQFIPVHALDGDITVVVQSDSGVVRDGDQNHEVSPSDVVTVPAGTDRGIRADGERLETVMVVSPPPTDAEHEPVRRGLKQNTFDPE